VPRQTSVRAVKKAISLPPDLARFAMATAREEGKTLSAVVQSYWSQRAREKGVLTESQLERYLKRGN